MAYPVASKTIAGDSALNVFTLKFPAHKENDVVVVWMSTRYGTSSISDTDFSVLQSSNESVYFYVAGSTQKSEVVWATTSNGGLVTGYAIIRKANIASIINAWDVSIIAANTRFDSPSVTPNLPNCLILTICAVRSIGNSSNLFIEPGLIPLSANNDSSDVNIAAAYTQHPDASATGTYEWMSPDYDTDSGDTFTIAINDDGTGYIPGYIDRTTPPFEYLALNVRNWGTGDLQASSVAHYDPTLIGENILSLTDGNSGHVNSNTRMQITYSPAFGGNNTQGCLYTSNRDYNGWLQLVGIDLATGIDYTNKTLCICIKLAGRWDLSDIGSFGAILGLSDGTNYRFFDISGGNARPNEKRGVFPTIIAPASLTHCVEHGSFSLSSAGNTHLIFGAEVNLNNEQLVFSPLTALNVITLLGGSANKPCSFSVAGEMSDAKLLYTVQAQHGQSKSQFYCLQSIKVGNGGSTAVKWDSTGQSVEYPAAWDYDSGEVQSQINSGALSLEFDVGAGTNFTVSAESINMGDFHWLKLLSGNHVGSGVLVTNARLQLEPLDSAVSGFIFSRCKEISYVALIDLSGGCTISDCIDAQSITVISSSDFAKLANCSFLDNDTAIKITGDQGGAWTDPNLTMSGNVYDIEYTGSTDFSIQSATTLTVNNSGSGTLTIDTPVPTLTITGYPLSATILIHDLDEADPQELGTELLRSESSGISVVYAGAAGNVIGITMLEPGYKAYFQQYTIGLTDATFTIIPELETN